MITFSVANDRLSYSSLLSAQESKPLTSPDAARSCPGKPSKRGRGLTEDKSNLKEAKIIKKDAKYFLGMVRNNVDFENIKQEDLLILNSDKHLLSFLLTRLAKSAANRRARLNVLKKKMNPVTPNGNDGDEGVSKLMSGYVNLLVNWTSGLK